MSRNQPPEPIERINLREEHQGLTRPKAYVEERVHGHEPGFHNPHDGQLYAQLGGEEGWIRRLADSVRRLRSGT